MENTIYGKHSKDNNMRMKLLDQEQTQVSTRTSDGPPNVLLWFLVPPLAIGSILCLVWGIGVLIEGSNRNLGLSLCVVVAPTLTALIVFLVTSKISGSYASSFELACLWLMLSSVLTMLIFVIADSQQQNRTENTREELMSEQGYENLEKRDKSTYYAEKDGKEYLLIVNEMKEDGEMKFEVTPFEKGTKESLN